MANFRRNKPATRTYGNRHGSRGHWLHSWPAYWDILFHTRPRRRETAQLERAILKGVDADNVVWPLGNTRPHKYYW